MTGQTTPFLVPPYSALSEVYELAGYADYAARAVPAYLTYLQSLDWAGRRILDIGCGTGLSAYWLAQQGYRVVGIDSSPYMLTQAEAKAAQQPEGYSLGVPDFVQMDIRHLESPLGNVDLVLAVGGVLNAIQSLRDFETTLAAVNRVLDAERLFVFDVYTLRGMSVNVGPGLDFDNRTDLAVHLRNHFSFESLSVTRTYTIWQRQGDLWQRRDERHIERGYPIQGISMVLERTGFDVIAIVDPDMRPFDVENDAQGRAVFVAAKRS